MLVCRCSVQVFYKGRLNDILRTGDTKDLAVFKPHSDQFTAPHASTIYRYEMLFLNNAQGGPMAKNNSVVLGGAIRNLEPREIAWRSFGWWSLK